MKQSPKMNIRDFQKCSVLNNGKDHVSVKVKSDKFDLAEHFIQPGYKMQFSWEFMDPALEVFIEVPDSADVSILKPKFEEEEIWRSNVLSTEELKELVKKEGTIHDDGHLREE